jgi:hypothetical protein
MVSPEQLGEQYLTVYHRRGRAVEEGMNATRPGRTGEVTHPEGHTSRMNRAAGLSRVAVPGRR